jgi:hypothetical protein
MIVNHIRSEFFPTATIANLFIPGFTKKIWVLEDTVRPDGIKIFGQTAIPDGLYQYKITYSPTFKRETVQLFNTPSDLSINHCGKRWEGIRVHGGNKVDDSLGCPLIAFNRPTPETIQGTAEAEVTAFLKANAPEGIWIITTKIY